MAAAVLLAGGVVAGQSTGTPPRPCGPRPPGLACSSAPPRDRAGQLQGASLSTLNTYFGTALQRWGSKIAYLDVVNEAPATASSGI